MADPWLVETPTASIDCREVVAVMRTEGPRLIVIFRQPPSVSLAFPSEEGADRALAEVRRRLGRRGQLDRLVEALPYALIVLGLAALLAGIARLMGAS